MVLNRKFDILRDVVFVALCFEVVNTSGECGTVIHTDKIVYNVGETMHINCSLSTGMVPDTTKFYMLHTSSHNKTGTNVSAIFNIIGSGCVVETEVITKTVSEAGTYTCLYEDCPNILLTSSVTVMVKAVDQRPILSCIWQNQWNMTCQWSLPDTNGVLAWKMLYRRKGAASYSCCVAPGGACSDFSLDTSCCILPTDLVPYLTYQMQLQARWVDKSVETYGYTVDVNNSILRCHLNVLDVSVNATRQFHLTSISDCAPASVGGLICRVSIASQWEPNGTFIQTFSSTSADLALEFTVDELEPFTKYNLSLVCRPETSTFWSNTLVTMATTLSEPPITPPKVIGYSEAIIGESIRNIVLYVEPHPQRQRYGENATFVVKFESHNGTVWRRFDAEDPVAVLDYPFLRNQAYVLTITTANEKGVSANTSVVNIARSDDKSGIIVADQTENGSYAVVLFGFKTDVRTCYYTCYVDDDVTPPHCKTALIRGCLDEAQGSYLVDPDSNTRRRKAVGVTFAMEPTQIFWSDCVFEFDYRYGDRKGITVSATRRNATTVEVGFNFRYCNQHARPLVYQAETRLYGNQSCSYEVADNITATPDLRHIPVTIDPGVKQLDVCFRVTFSDDTHESDVATVTMDIIASAVAARRKPRSTQIGVGVTVGLAVSLLVVLVFAVKKYQQRVKSRNLVQDIVTDMVLPPGSDSTGYCKLNAAEDDGKQNHDRKYNNLQQYKEIDVIENVPRGEMTSSRDQVQRETSTGGNGIRTDTGRCGDSQGRNSDTTDKENLHIDEGDVNHRSTGKPFDDKTTQFLSKPTSILVHSSQQLANVTRSLSVDATNVPRSMSVDFNSPQNEAWSDESGASVYSSSCGVDSYTTVTCQIDSGHSVSNYVTATETTSY